MNARFFPVTSVALDPGPHPFAATEAECRMNGDDWAWRFLRLNPFYRHDCALAKSRPALLDELCATGLPGSQAAFDEIKAFDVRYFRLGSMVAGSADDWTEVAPCTLGAYLAAHPHIEPTEVSLRNLDCARLYGIADWFDPAVEALPALPEGRSWFFGTSAPIVEMGDRFSIAPFARMQRAPSGREVCVGHEGSVRREERPRRVGRVERMNERGEWIVTSENLIDLDVTRPGFAQVSEMLFAVSLDGHLPPQIRAVSEIAHAYRQLLNTQVSARRLPRARIDYRPLVFRPDPAVTEPFGEMRARLANLADAPALIRQNWYLVLVDVAHALPAQFTAIEKRLRECQQRERHAAELAKLVRKPSRQKLPGDFWLKRALCALELQLNLAPYCEGKPLAEERVARAVYDATDPLHRIVWRGEIWGAARPFNGPDAALLNDASRLGRRLSARDYAFLVGSCAEEIAPTAP
ncbi:hypothetical protein [Paraburkholderia phosphatilytica]|uniref:hypothetical protein n=1 Tax=Paraburkholderia phosphatilytica TaxID=2282883 RepID=UPI000E4DDEBE|nr:hypothetical protein [Paraburkholderia phosphatilytica]